MAEMTSSNNQQQKTTGVKKGKKLSTRVDLTPMVDLGFLLITFFIFTTTMSQATAMKLIMPKDTATDSSIVRDSDALTFLLAKNNGVYYYQGILAPDASNLKQTSFSGMRTVIIDRQKQLPHPRNLMVIIKPEKESVYKNTVDALDEMTINNVTRYAMVDISPIESLMIQNVEHKSNLYKSSQ